MEDLIPDDEWRILLEDLIPDDEERIEYVCIQTHTFHTSSHTRQSALQVSPPFTSFPPFFHFPQSALRAELRARDWCLSARVWLSERGGCFGPSAKIVGKPRFLF